MDDIDLYNIAEAAIRLFEHLPRMMLVLAIEDELQFRQSILRQPPNNSISARQHKEGQRWNRNVLERLNALQTIFPTQAKDTKQ